MTLHCYHGNQIATSCSVVTVSFNSNSDKIVCFLSVEMSRAHAESVIKNIIQKIAQQCAERGNVVSDTLAAFMVSKLKLTK